MNGRKKRRISRFDVFREHSSLNFMRFSRGGVSVAIPCAGVPVATPRGSSPWCPRGGLSVAAPRGSSPWQLPVVPSWWAFRGSSPWQLPVVPSWWAFRGSSPWCPRGGLSVVGFPWRLCGALVAGFRDGPLLPSPLLPSPLLPSPSAAPPLCGPPPPGCRPPRPIGRRGLQRAYR